ncbi:kinectin-like isoform X2 [Scleropages formosus]|uniref:kinectin-like isoform X2 n=1 Tax=Scleropages formosus TaxID=113540 RepID=UPI0010FA762A|nr:kinectin isoform X2 [Scleropages formosus]
MAMELYDAQYLLILAPTLVIALMFLFFWLFMKETSYDEVLARQKRELKLPPSKPDARKKGDKKKSKKKESSGSSGGGGSGGGGGGESEEDPRDFDLTDAVVNPTPEEEQPLPTPPAPILPAPTPVEPPSAVRERKKKEKKQQQQQVTAPRVTPGPAPTSAPTSIPTPTHAPEEPTPIREVNGSKPTPRKNEPVLPVTKQPSPPSVEPSGKKKGSQKKQKSEASELAKEKQADELQLETKVEQAAVQSRKEIPVAVDAKVQDGTSVPTTSTTSSKKKNSAKKQKTEPVLVNEPPVQASLYIPLTDSDSPAPSSAQKGHHQDAPVKVNAKKQKNETDKEHSEVKLKDFLAGLRSLALSEEEAVSVAAVLREKSPSALDAWHRSAAKAEPSAQQIQERERLLTTLQEEASIAKEKVKQLSQELQMEKQKTGRVEALLRDQRGAMEEQLSVMQAKAQNSYQEVQMKFQQAREQLEGQISRLQQENKILRDAVSTATNQMESKQASELNQLRSERAALIKELSESGSKLQQEDMQRKSLEVNYKQNISQLEAQLQDAKCRWEELQGFLHSVNADREKLQANKQELQNKLLAAESEMGNKNKEIQNLHSSLTDMMVTKEELERKVMQLLEVSQRPPPDDSLQVQDLLTENKSLQVQIENLQSQVAAQTTTALHIDELQKLLAEKEHQRKSLEDSLNTERSAGASRENDMQALHTENMMLKAELQKAQAQMAEQASSQLVLDQLQKSALEKDEKIKTVEKLLEAGLIEVANKEEDLKTLREKNEALKRGMEALQLQQSQRMPSESVLEELQRVGLRRAASLDGLRVAEDSSQGESEPCKDSYPSTDDDDLDLLYKLRTGERQPSAFKEVGSSGGDSECDTDPMASLWVQEKDESMRMVQEKLQAEMDKVLSKEKALKELEKQVDDLRAEVERARQRENEETAASRTQLQELRSLLAAKDEEVQTLRKALREATWDTAEKEQHIQTLQEESSVLRIQLAEQQQVQAEGPSQELLSGLLEKEAQLSHLQTELEELRASLELQRRKNNELREKNWSAMDALSATESMLQGKLSKTAQESQKAVEAAEASCREVLHRLLPSVPLPSSQNHQEWLQRFETAAKQVFLVEPVPAIESGDTKMLEEKLKESEEAQKVLQKDCETYKKVLAETEGILQRLQNSVEQEESRWRVRLEVSQGELNEMNLKVVTLESEVDRLNSEVGDLENLRHDKQHLESELERAERESATYVTEVRELKDLLTELQSKLDGSYTEAIRQNEELTLLKSQLTETLFKLETEEKERQKVAGDLYKAQQSLDLIQAEILKEVGQADLIENSTIATQREEMDRREKTTAGLDETVRELQQLLQAVNRQLTKGREADGDKYTADV